MLRVGPHGWWNLYRLDLDADAARPAGGDAGAEPDGGSDAAMPLWPMDAEFGLPQWQFGGASFGFDGDDIVCAYGPAGARRLGRIEAATGRTSTYDLAYTEIGGVRVADRRAFIVASSPTESAALVAVDVATGEERSSCAGRARSSSTRAS
ncbi:MAG: hypothetical protein U0470_06610 [Anaerolineae bacterium]